MDEVAATTSSSPAFGFASSTAMSRSYSDPLLGDFRRHFVAVARELLQDREQARVEEADLEEHQERQRAVDLVDQRVVDGGGEVEAERQLDHRLHAHLLLVLLAGPLAAPALDAVLGRPRELAFLVEHRLEHGA